MGYIYFLQLEKRYTPRSTGRGSFLKVIVPAKGLKIGCTRNLKQRLREHEKTLPPFTVLGAIVWKDSAESILRRGDYLEAESLIHRQFSFSRIDKRGGLYKQHEFFKSTQRLLTFIKRNAVPLDLLDNAPAHELVWVRPGGSELISAFLPESLFGNSEAEKAKRAVSVFLPSGLKIPEPPKYAR